ncbi:hypothetical protein RRG08_051243 [Elysia crispata]|uniref:PiggyBac transposable element-derived protein domain-containing protein n=1 Tax=Elysia crispata TaxID=231223 RepID=A0AAE0ZTM1_9GAST|nr:hypothetical protein RRG08_051243 [Elysia crispata]
MLQGANCLNLGHHLGLDNYFSSPKLFIDLYNEHTTATGTVRVNRKGLPKQVLKQSLQNQEVAERRKGPLLCVAYKDGNRRPVLLSTVARAGYDIVVNRRGQNTRKPSIVQVYNKAMGGVDLSDAKLYTYLAERRTLKWTKKVFISLIGRALLNSYILYSKNVEGRVLNRHSYNISVIESFVGDYRPSKIPRKRRSMQDIAEARNQPINILPPQHAHEPGPSTCKLVKLEVGKRRDCVNGHEKRTRSSYECSNCNVGLCPGCFTEYHNTKNL